jgi:hypothetical protein
MRLQDKTEGLTCAPRSSTRGASSGTTLGGLFNRVRPAHMDREGVDHQVIYGSIALAINSLWDAELARAARQASFAFEIFTSKFSVICAFLRTAFSVV